MILTGIYLSFIAYVFTRILLEDVLLRYTRFLHTLPQWLGKPLGLCAVCFTGQLSLWAMLPLVCWDFSGIMTYLGIVSLNMIIVKFLTYAEKD